MAQADQAASRVISLSTAMVLLGFQAAGMVAIGWLLWSWSSSSVGSFVAVSGEGLLAGVGIGAGFVVLAFMLFKGFPGFGERMIRLQSESYGFLGPRLGWPAIALISLCAGVGEEALFRGGIQNFLADHIGVAGAILVSSGLFAALHLGKPVITALLLVVGVVFGVAYVATGSLLAVIIGHALYDIWALRYLHSQFLRLGLLDSAETQPALANTSPDV